MIQRAVLLLTLLPVLLLAESYRWTDADGNVHFSDQPPSERDRDQAEEIELENPEPIGQGENVQRTREELDELHRERQKRREKARRENRKQERQRLQSCQKKSRLLSRMKNNRVQYKQEDGTYKGVSEDKHQARIRELEQWLERNCQDR